jgi:mono/diheme cytochrome c family protein
MRRNFRLVQENMSANTIGHFVTFPAASIHHAALRLAAFGLLAVQVGQPAFAADPFNGQRLAERWCAACHVVTVSQRQANADAPPFEEIAKRPGFTQLGLATFLLDPHAKMPNMNLTRIEAADIAAYVNSLR